jgi:hypothetical protein
MKYVLLILTTILPFCGEVLGQNAGNALLFDGSDDYVWSNPNVSALAEGTIEMWFRADTFQQSTALGVGGQGHPGANWDNGYRFGTHSSAGEGIAFGIWTGAWNWSQSGFIPSVGIWHHIACTWGNTGIKIYIDGQPSGFNGYAGANQSYNFDLIGTSSWGDYFAGAIDEVRFWNIARNSTQINATIMDTLGQEYTSTSDSGLVAYYKFDELEDFGIDTDGSDDVRDFSTNENHGDTRGGISLISSGGFIITGIEEMDTKKLLGYTLKQNYPNPFNPITTIEYRISQATRVEIKIYNIMGQEINTLVNKIQSIGNHKVLWDGRDKSGQKVSSGIYLYHLKTGLYNQTQKMIFLQ